MNVCNRLECWSLAILFPPSLMFDILAYFAAELITTVKKFVALVNVSISLKLTSFLAR